MVTPFATFLEEAVPEPVIDTEALKLLGSTKVSKVPDTVSEPSYTYVPVMYGVVAVMSTV